MTIKKTQKNTFFNVRPELPVCLFLVLGTLAVYWQVKDFSFVNYDDRRYVTQNQYVQAGLTLKSIKWSITESHASNWHPLTWMSHMLDCQIYGLDPGRHHLTSLVFHILNTLLLFLVFKKMTGTLWKSATVAALFALHPLHVESVAWVAERKDVLSAFFFMLTLWSYTRYVERSDFSNYLLVVLFFMLGLMAKPMVVTLPFVFILIDYWPLNRFQLNPSDNDNQAIQRPFYFKLIWEKIPLFLLSFISSVVTYLVQNSSGAVNSLAAIPFHVRIANALISYVSYIGKMIWPQNLAVLYPYRESISLLEVVGAGLLLLGVSVVAFRLRRSKQYFAVGWLWYIGTLVPVIGIVQVGAQSMADRYTYVPLIGLFILVAWGVPDLLRKWRHKRIGFAAITTVILAILMITTWFQIKYWSQSTTLFSRALDVTKKNSVAHLNLGEALAEQGKIEAAVKHYQEALRIKPNLVAAHLNMGVYFRERGELDEAVDHFSKVLNIKSDCAEARYELGNTFEKKGDHEGAIKNYFEAVRIKPEYEKVYNKLALLFVHQNKKHEAIVLFNKAIQINPAYAGAYFNIGKIFANEGRIDEAIFNYQKALSLKKDMSQALYHLSWILSTHEDKKYRNGQKAVTLATILCDITQNIQPLALDALAAAYAETGQFDKAVSTAQKALQISLKEGPQELALGLKKRLAFYQKGHPYRQTSPEEGHR